MNKLIIGKSTPKYNHYHFGYSCGQSDWETNPETPHDNILIGCLSKVKTWSVNHCLSSNCTEGISNFPREGKTKILV